MKKSIAIIGAGISGLVLAQRLKDQADVVVYEKARGVGGRMSTRYADPFYFDHGTQFFTARTQKFQGALTPYIERGHIAEWAGKVISLENGKEESNSPWNEPHFVASPNMNSLCKKLAEGLDIKLSTEIRPLPLKHSGAWPLSDKTGSDLGTYDWVISTAPPAQTLTLFPDYIPADNSIYSARLMGCYALMIGFGTPWQKEWIAAHVKDNPIKWISINSTKPGRSNAVTSIVAHSHHDWAEDHMDDDMEEAQKFLIRQFEFVTGISCAQAEYISVHRWKYAIAEPAESSRFYMNPEQKLAAVSDWSSASRIEDVWLTADSLAEELIGVIQE